MKAVLPVLVAFAVVWTVDALIPAVCAAVRWMLQQRRAAEELKIAAERPRAAERSAPPPRVARPSANAIRVRPTADAAAGARKPQGDAPAKAGGIGLLPASVLAQAIGDPKENAERLWSEAQKMPHSKTPDRKKDLDYLKTLTVAARLGHFGAMKELSAIAFAQKKVVEAYYWIALAELYGATDVTGELRRLKAVWLSRNCPGEHDNVHQDFTRSQGSFARALLRLRSAKEYNRARKRLKSLADSGLAEAQLFVEKNKIRIVPSSSELRHGHHA